MKVYIVVENIDLGYHIASVHKLEIDAIAEVSRLEKQTVQDNPYRANFTNYEYEVHEVL